MRDQLPRVGVTPLMALYGVFAAAGAIILWIRQRGGEREMPVPTAAVPSPPAAIPCLSMARRRWRSCPE